MDDEPEDIPVKMGALKRWLKKARAGEMTRRCSHLISKVYLIIFNLVFLLCGFATLAMGIWMKFDRDTFVALQLAEGSPSGPLFDSIPFALMGIGVTMIIMCFAGGCGACAESVCFLCFYSIVLFVLVLAQIIVVLIIVARKEYLQTEFSNRMLHQVRINYNRSTIRDVNKTDPMTYAWDAMQVELKCCGAVGADDYMFSTWWNHTKNSAGMFVPHTCCALYNDNPEVPMVRDNNQCQIEGSIYPKWRDRNMDTDRLEELHTTGCVHAVLAWIERHSHIFISCLVSSIILQVLGLFTSCFMITRLKREHGKELYDEEDG